MVVSFQSRFPDSNEYAIVVWGQSNGRPWGDRDTEGFAQAPHLRLARSGVELRIIGQIPILIPAGKVHGDAGTQTNLVPLEELTDGEWAGATCWCYRVEHSEASAPPTRTVTIASGATAVVDGDGNLVVTQGGGGTAPNKYHTVGMPITMAGWTIGAGTFNINTRYTLVAVSGTAWTLKLNRGTFTTVSATASGTCEASYMSPITYGKGRVVSNSTGGVLVEWETKADVGHVQCVTIIANREDELKGPHWSSYESIRGLHMYQPETAEEYPAGVPAVPGFTSVAAMNTFESLGLFSEFTFHEGVEGYGLSGTVTSVTSTSITDSTADFVPDIFKDGWVLVKNADRSPRCYAKVTTNSATKVDVANWIGQDPATNNLYEVWCPHFADSPHAVRLGNGFRQPTNDPQPVSASAFGWTYNRPLNRRSPGYNGRSQGDARVSPLANVSRVARYKGGNLTATLVGGTAATGPYRLRIERTDDSILASTEEMQFNWFLVPEDIVSLANWAIGTGGYNINGQWRVKVVEPWTGPTALGGTPSYIDLEPITGSLLTVATVINATAVGTSGSETKVTKLIWNRIYRYGCVLEMANRIALALGKRIHIIHLAVNGAGMLLHNVANFSGFKGRIGWWDWREHLDWTPAHASGTAARLERVIKSAPLALQAEGSTKPLKVIGIFGLHGETDALYPAGRDTYLTTLRTFYDWLRGVISAAGMSFGSGLTPVVHPLITTGFWSEPSPGGGDTSSAIRSAVTQLAGDATFKFFTIETNTFEKLDQGVFGTDPRHFNGVGESKMGAACAKKWQEALEA